MSVKNEKKKTHYFTIVLLKCQNNLFPQTWGRHVLEANWKLKSLSNQDVLDNLL